MVTIEQKISMFSKLLQRSMNENIAAEMERLKRDYEKKISENKNVVDKEVEAIHKRAMKKAETEKIEILSKSAIALKRQYMSAKEELFSTMMVHLYAEIEQFMQSAPYEDYLMMSMEKLKKANAFSDAVDIYMTKSDHSKYAEGLLQILPKATRDKVILKIADNKIIGGMILLNPAANTRIDLSVRALLEENKPYMMQLLFQSLLE